MLARQVFISYATEDVDTASRVCELLEADGIQCWLVSRDGAENQDKAAAILEAIRSSSLVLLIFSASANASPTVLRDIERAISYERPVLSLHLDDALPNPSLEYYLNLWQWLDASAGVDDKQDDILAAVREQLAGTSDAGPWRGLDAPEGVDTKREEILAAVRGHLAQSDTSAQSQEAEAAAAGRWRPSRRTWGIMAAAALLVLALGLGLGLGLRGTVVHQGTWTKLEPGGAEPPRGSGLAMVYEPSSERLFLYGGSAGEVLSDTTWAYDPVANTWTELEPSGTLPPPLDGSSMAYDPNTQRLILFGGFDRFATHAAGGWIPHNTNDTWAYDPVANTWTELRPAGTVPPPRLFPTMAYDPAAQKMILFGGEVDVAEVSEQELESEHCFLDVNDTWAYDPIANSWTELQPEGALPPVRAGHQMVHDSSTGLMIMFGGGQNGGGVFNDTWAYDPVANTWTELAPSGALPKARYASAMACDPSSQRVIMFGGSNIDSSKFFDDIWAYDPVANTWTELKPSGTRPGARAWQSLVYTPPAGYLVMFGQGGTWSFTP